MTRLTVSQMLAYSKEVNAAEVEKPKKSNWRAAWKKQVGHCQNPECTERIVPGFNPLTVHEICRGVHRTKATERRECCLVLCYLCNANKFTDYSAWPVERQCALKLVTDAEWFDLKVINETRSRASAAITILDLVPFLTLRRD